MQYAIVVIRTGDSRCCKWVAHVCLLKVYVKIAVSKDLESNPENFDSQFRTMNLSNRA